MDRNERPELDTLSPSIVLGAYAESLFDGRRVVLFGDATTSLAEEIAERGARVVHVYDPIAARAAEAGARNRDARISALPLDGADIAVRDGAFDLAIVEDLSSIEEPAKLLHRVRRALTPRGAAIVASPNPEARLALVPRKSAASSSELGYYDLYDLVSSEFPDVRMLGQTPFVGYAIVDFAPEEEPEVNLDSGLVPGGAEEPEWFVAVASSAPVDVDAFDIVQLPALSVLPGGTDAKTAEDLRVSRANEARLVERVAALEEDLAERKGAALAAPDVSSDRVRELEEGITLRDARIAELLARATAAEARASGAGAEAEALRAAEKRAHSLESARAELATRLSDLVKEKDALTETVTTLRADMERTAQRLAQREAEMEQLTQANTEDGPDDIARLEASLRERAERIRALERELREAERMGKELVREAAGARAAERPAVPQTEGGGPLSTENARLRADIEALGWTIQELEDRLAGVSAG